jgi:hypothetical protein
VADERVTSMHPALCDPPIEVARAMKPSSSPGEVKLDRSTAIHLSVSNSFRSCSR